MSMDTEENNRRMEFQFDLACPCSVVGWSEEDSCIYFLFILLSIIIPFAMRKKDIKVWEKLLLLLLSFFLSFCFNLNQTIQTIDHPKTYHILIITHSLILIFLLLLLHCYHQTHKQSYPPSPFLQTWSLRSSHPPWPCCSQSPQPS